MSIKNKTRKTLRLDKSYTATTRFVQNENGDIEQRTTLYEHETGSQRQPIYQTKHCRVQVTKESLLMYFKFNRKRLPTFAISGCVYDETNLITDFIESEPGSKAIMIADKELNKAAEREEDSL